MRGISYKDDYIANGIGKHQFLYLKMYFESFAHSTTSQNCNLFPSKNESQHKIKFWHLFNLA